MNPLRNLMALRVQHGKSLPGLIHLVVRLVRSTLLYTEPSLFGFVLKEL